MKFRFKTWVTIGNPTKAAMHFAAASIFAEVAEKTKDWTFAWREVAGVEHARTSALFEQAYGMAALFEPVRHYKHLNPVGRTAKGARNVATD